MKLHLILAGLLMALAADVSAEEARPPDSRSSGMKESPPSKLRGMASGGELIVSDARNPSPSWRTLKTEPGESAESVVARAYEAVRSARAGRPGITPLPPRAAEGDLRLLGGNTTVLHGSESGLGIPPAPLGLSGFFDLKEELFHLSWTNPPGEPYDRVMICGLEFIGAPWISERDAAAEAARWGTATRIARPGEEPPPGPETNHFMVWAVRDGVHSAAAALYISGGVARESLGFPHVDGVTPNWLRWSLEGDALPETAQGQREDGSVRPGAVPTSPEEMRVYQQISPRSSAASGLIRPLNGYKAGDAVALSGRLRLDEALRDREDWSVEFRMVHLADLASAIDSRSSMRLTAEALEDSTPLGRIGPGSALAHGEWFTFGGLDDPAVPLEMWRPDGAEGSSLFAIGFSGMDGARIDMDWFTAERLN